MSKLRQYIRNCAQMSRKDQHRLGTRVYDDCGQGVQIAWCHCGDFMSVNLPLISIIGVGWHKQRKTETSNDERRAVYDAFRDQRLRGVRIRLP